MIHRIPFRIALALGLAVGLFALSPLWATPPIRSGQHPEAAVCCKVQKAAPKAVCGLVARQPVVQIALLLDTSNSMDGLIGQAKTQLWNIVNQFDAARQHGQRPNLQVALYQYGTPSLGADNGFIRQILPFTSDLDRVSEELFALQTQGGDEYCGTVIGSAVRDLAWSNIASDYRAIFIAGNEPFNQGHVDFHASAQHAVDKDIVVNTIFCGQNSEGVHTYWKEGATLTDGCYTSIDQNAVAVHIEAPQDQEILQLNVLLNQTYIGYGQLGKDGAQRQRDQDKNAAAFEGSLLSRAVTKSSGSYTNSAWDLVDAVKQQGVKLEEIETKNLPKDMQGMTEEQRLSYIDTKAKERADIQGRIRQLTKQRDAYVTQQKKAHAAAPANTLDEVITEAVREQAQNKNYKFEPDEEVTP